LNYNFEVIKGKQALVRKILETINQVKSSIIISIPVTLPEIMEAIKQAALQKKRIRFMVISDFQFVNNIK